MPRKLPSNAEKQFIKKLDELFNLTSNYGIATLGHDRDRASTLYEEITRKQAEIVKMYNAKTAR